MSRSMIGVVLAALFVCFAVVAPRAQTTSASEMKTFEVIEVEGNTLVVRLPEGTKELTVPDDFRFTVNGQQMSVHQLKAGMKGTATITTRTTLVPVTVTEVKNGTVAVATGSAIIVRTPEGVKSFTQSDVDKRGVKIMLDGRLVQVNELHQGDRLTATIITSLPPKVVTEQEVNATLAAASAGGGSGAAARSGSSGTRASASAAPQGSAAPQSTARASSQGAAPSETRALPKTATSWPLFGLASLLSLAIGLALTISRRLIN
jgi:hypothetical protein